MELRNLPSVKKHKDLTDRAWQSIKPVIIEALEWHKAQRLERKRNHSREVHQLRLAMLRVHMTYRMPIVPPCPDLFVMQPFKDMIDAPISANINFTVAHIVAAVVEWQCAKDAQLMRLVAQHCPHVDVNTRDALFLATTVFRCEKYGLLFNYPEVLTHTCPSDELDTGSKIPWWPSCRRLVFDVNFYQYARDRIESYRLNPDLMTRNEARRYELDLRVLYHVSRVNDWC
ncbi:hypothetical protein H0H81_010663 [Sphagnurus paluster]|uniref:Uncharacterized protein n=1 Tax=Sphagnurus paluster TaxID=117069 RepID=A0A9P7GJJ3_9AGAR|nr:hypothetical protein H0H81_010663 [Sphagnurus paluster]